MVKASEEYVKATFSALILTGESNRDSMTMSREPILCGIFQLVCTLNDTLTTPLSGSRVHTD